MYKDTIVNSLEYFYYLLQQEDQEQMSKENQNSTMNPEHVHGTTFVGNEVKSGINIYYNGDQHIQQSPRDWLQVVFKHVK